MNLSMSTSTKRFVRHYLEMVFAMFAGMVVLGVPLVAALEAAGITMDEMKADAPAVVLLGMAVTMTVPMVGWMIRRGHSSRANAEMAASMFLPTFAVIGLLGAGAVTDFHTLMMLEHIVMLPAMLLAMLLRRDEYAHDHAAHAAHVVA